jgi:glycosyltransferase involved in cell wall biosynthesis
MHELIKGLPEIDFVLFTISPQEDQELRYELPDNVVEHKDLVVWRQYSSTAHPQNTQTLIDSIERFHRGLFAQAPGDITEMVSQIPEGFFLHEDAVRSEKGWNLIIFGNETRNPLYPFSDYFWAWGSAHSMLFTTLGSSPPDADLYHSVSTGFAGIAALAAKIRRGKPFLLTEHGLYHKEREMEIRKAQFVRGYQRDMWIKTYNSLSTISYRNADRITALFEENRQKQIELGASEEKSMVIPNGIDVERFSIERKPRPGFHVGLVGRVVPIKDIKTYIATAKIVLDQIPEATFYCIGPTDEDPGYYEDCKLMVESLKLSDRFIFTGRQNVLEYYAFLDVMLLTSIREAQPLVILEAYCAGVPVVATRVGNVAELLDYDNRFIAPLKDSEKLAEGILYVYNHEEEMQRLREQNKRKVHSFYNREELIGEYLSLYREMCHT